MRKRLLAIIATAAMVVTMIPAVAFGAVPVTTLDELQAALAGSETEITVTQTIEIPAGADVTIDLKGKTISMKDSSGTTAALIKNNGNLTIKDSVGTGKITFSSTTPSASNSYASNAISNYGTITINGGTIENTTVGGACYALDNYAGSTATIFGGKLSAAKTAVRIFNWTDGDAAKAILNVKGGEIISADGYGINLNMGNTPNVELNISGGTITTNDTDYNLAVYVVTKGSAENVEINVSGGTFDGNFALNGLTSTTITEGKVSVSGGKFTGVICYGDPTFGFVSGGTFEDEPDEAYLADNVEWDEETGKVIDPNAPTTGGESTTIPEKSPNTGDNSMAPIAVAGLVLAAMAAVVATRRRTN